MAISTTILAAAALAATAAGTATSVYGQSQQASAQRAAEDQRRKAMELDAQRRSIEQIRQQQRAQAMSTATTTAQGASYGSGLPGSFGQFAGQTAFNLQGINQNRQIGEQLFDINKQVSYGSQVSGIGSGLSGLGQVGLQSLGAYNRLSNSNWGFGYDPYSDPTKLGGRY